MRTPCFPDRLSWRAMRVALLACSASAISFAAAPPPPWHYAGRLGLTGAPHTAADGYQVSEVVEVADSGHTLGVSLEFVGADDVPETTGRRAQSGWIAGPDGATRQVGLTDATHTRDDGRHETYPIAVNDHGLAIGASARFVGHRLTGTTAWLAHANGATTVFGFYDAAHTASDGSTLSEPIALSGANKLIGYSENPENGHRTGWVANSVGQINAIGLTDASHTSADGVHATFPVAINDAGLVIGNSDYFAVNDTFPGATAWIRRLDRVLRTIGFQSGAHQAPGGQHLSRALLLTESGYVGGWSTRYQPSTGVANGQTTWVTHVDGPNRPVGFYSGIHVGANGVMHSDIRGLSEQGCAIGASYQYHGANPDEFDVAGSTAWISTPAGATVRVGFYDAEHTANGHQFNDLVAHNRNDSAVGNAVRYTAAGDYHGSDGFVANSAGYTTKVGLNGAVHTGADGYHASYATALTDGVGYVAGYTERYRGGTTQLGQTAWIYHRSTRTYVPLELSVRPSDGYAESEVTRLLPDGSAVGWFRKFDAAGADLGDRAFVYVSGSGVYELDQNLDVDPGAQGWAYLAEATHANDAGTIVGTGAVAGGGTYGLGVFLVNEAVAAARSSGVLMIDLAGLKLKLKL